MIERSGNADCQKPDWFMEVVIKNFQACVMKKFIYLFTYLFSRKIQQLVDPLKQDTIL